MDIDRSKLIEEQRLRSYIKKAIKVVQKKRLDEQERTESEEDKLRSYLVKLIEADVGSPHGSTGINVLEDLLKKIIPQLEIEYKKLTTDPDQRASFRTHILNAIQNSLAPTKISDKAGSEEEAERAIDIGLEENMDSEVSNELGAELDGLSPGDTMVLQRSSGRPDKFFIKGNEDGTFSMSVDFSEPPRPAEDYQNASKEKMLDWAEAVFKEGDWRKLFSGRLSESVIQSLKEADEIEIEVGDEAGTEVADEEFIDIDSDGVEEEETEEERFGINGEDETGRNIAFSAFERVEQAIVDSYSLLSNDGDRELFYDYLITNIKLYFDKFEDELLRTLPEPTTPEYEQEKDMQADALEEPLEEPLEQPEDLEL